MQLEEAVIGQYVLLLMVYSQKDRLDKFLGYLLRRYTRNTWYRLCLRVRLHIRIHPGYIHCHETVLVMPREGCCHDVF